MFVMHRQRHTCRLIIDVFWVHQHVGKCQMPETGAQPNRARVLAHP